ncbi:multiple epidermal growth factor-like domains protein 10 isoform X2 [Haliotis rufescens]|uniref:multiple epidermal growth factor-like domains protein 10 isoform X2 n=1 Tax=Haliotis rufescens TaxID=6454 RepID=UPI00201F3E05|nr:multiple epidermal growth factor-like domains protein 10 isoform X2 [Haliotis rufescens]
MVRDKDTHASHIFTLYVSSPQLIVVHEYFDCGQRQVSQLYSQAETTSWLSNMAGVWILTVTVVTSACLIQVIICSCPTGKFGDSCFYSCHCGDSCDQTTGVCGGGCESGWMGGNGSYCQKENIAKGKSATTPSGLHLPSWSADKVVDGNQDQDYLHFSCFHASLLARPSVWTVDLGQPYRIHDVRIYNRRQSIDRLQTAVLSLSNSSSSTPGVTCYTFPSDTAETDNSVYDVTCDGTGRHFTITHSTETLNLFCSHGTFGELCNHFCHCSDGHCDRFSGICAGDCRPGWQGQNCSTACDKDQYGVNCNETCGNRKCAAAPPSCDRHTGSCDTGCLPGWIEVDCKQECYPGTYGQNCSLLCTERNCAGNSPCDHVTGKCVSRCKPGWMGIDCVQACDSQHYGPNCIKTCASRHCMGSSSCNSTGGCDTGCETGWTQTDCTASLHVPQENNPVGGEETLIPAVTVTTIVVVVVAAVVVGVVCWRRRRRPSLQESDSNDYYNTSHLAKVQTKQSRDNDETQLEERTYDGLNVMSREIQGTGETYCTLNTEKPDLEGGAAAEVAEMTDRDIYEPTEPRTYETLDSTSRDMIGEYSELGKIA